MTPKLKRQDGIQALVVVPTRELALQTHEIFNKINVSLPKMQTKKNTI